MNDLNIKFAKEYKSSDSLRRYTTSTAGYGISYLLEHEYKDIYLNAIHQNLSEIQNTPGMKILEYGCGAGMNLISLLKILKRRSINVHNAYGTDFSKVLIDAAKKEAQTYLEDEEQSKTYFYVARNESLVQDICTTLKLDESQITNSFHLIMGINTFRYCHRLKMENECASDIHKLLIPGGISIMIDMNDKFPFFRSKFHKKRGDNPIETYIPNLDEYARPFENAGFEILKRENFCWIPHSSQSFTCHVLRAFTPILQMWFARLAMRSLVIAKK